MDQVGKACHDGGVGEERLSKFLRGPVTDDIAAHIWLKSSKDEWDIYNQCVKNSTSTLSPRLR